MLPAAHRRDAAFAPLRHNGYRRQRQRRHRDRRLGGAHGARAKGILQHGPAAGDDISVAERFAGVLRRSRHRRRLGGHHRSAVRHVRTQRGALAEDSEQRDTECAGTQGAPRDERLRRASHRMAFRAHRGKGSSSPLPEGLPPGAVELRRRADMAKRKRQAAGHRRVGRQPLLAPRRGHRPHFAIRDRPGGGQRQGRRGWFLLTYYIIYVHNKIMEIILFENMEN